MTDDPDEVVPGASSPDPDPQDLPAPAGAPLPAPPNRPGRDDVHDRGPGVAGPVRHRLARVARWGSRSRSAAASGGSGVLALLVGPGLLSLGLIAACGNQAFERRAHGAAYAGPSPFLVFGTVVAITFFVAFVVGFVLLATIGDEAKVSAPVGELVAGCRPRRSSSARCA